MKHLPRHRPVRYILLMGLFFLTLGSCDRTSSPEGRMSIKIEALQKELIDSLRQQNKAILDSLHHIREDLEEIRHREK